MFSNYFKVALRNLIKLRGYAALNIVGLAVGLACCLLTIQYLREELSIDQHHVDKENIYRISTDFSIGERQFKTSVTPPTISFAIKKDFPEVLESARIFKAPSLEKFLVKVGDRSFFEKNGIYADSTFFRVLTYDFIAGDPRHALDAPNSIVISEALAKKLFQNQNPLGETIELESLWGEDLCTVTGIFNKETYSTHIDGDFYISSTTGNVGRRFYRLQEWGGNNLFHTFVHLHPDTNPKIFEAKLPEWLEGYAGDRLRELGFKKRHFLEKIGRVYLYSNLKSMVGPTGNITFIYIIASISLLILLIACINFMNLATAKATIRAKEVGIRKVVGASRTMLFRQFMFEALMYTTVAVILAYMLAETTMPIFNELTNKNLTFNALTDIGIWPILIGCVLLTTLLVGSYPALYLTSFNPINIIKGTFGDRLSAKQIRKGLVVIQFIVSIALIQGVLVINEQMRFIKNKELGFDTAHKVIIPHNSANAAQQFTALKNELLRDNRILNAGGTSSYPGSLNLESMLMYTDGQTQEEGSETYMVYTEPDYLDLMDFEIVAGRSFNKERIADTLRSVVINQTLAKELGFDDQSAIGKRLYYDWQDNHHTYNIIGVVKDFHASSLYQAINSQLFLWDASGQHSYLVADVQSSDLTQLIGSLEASWEKINPSDPFEFYFLDDQMQQNYQADQRMSGLVLWATILAILISCLGLLGLATFAAERRTKEIGVRKILGATISNIIGLLSKDFLWLVALGFVIASPIAWYAMTHWLQDFHYRIDMPWWSFGLAGLFALIIAFSTIGWQAIKAAKADPVQALRVE